MHQTMSSAQARLPLRSSFSCVLHGLGRRGVTDLTMCRWSRAQAKYEELDGSPRRALRQRVSRLPSFCWGPELTDEMAWKRGAGFEELQGR